METLVMLSTLPPFGIFRTAMSGLRGLILRWIRRGSARRIEALVLLLCGGYTERRRLRGGLAVLVDGQDAAINSQHPTDALGDDPFLNRWGWSKSSRQVATPLSVARHGRSNSLPLSFPCADFG